MNCLEFRRLYCTDPEHNAAELREHQRDCAACAAFAAEQDAFDETIERAVRISSPTGLESRILLRQSLQEASSILPHRRMVYALAATLLIGVAIGFGILSIGTGDALDSEVISYLQTQPSFPSLTSASAEQEANALLRPAGMELQADGVAVHYAKPCVIKDTPAVHLVIAGERGAVSVVFMPEQDVAVRKPFVKAGFNGVIVPCPKGSMAIVGAHDEPIDNIEQRVRAAVSWL
jgi:hypothetical protein